MEINTSTATIYNIPDAGRPPAEDVEKISLWQLPKILWASAILFFVNVVIAAGIGASPELNVDILGESTGDVVPAAAKPSAFVKPEPQPRAVRAATKLQPIVEIAPDAAMDAELLNVPRATMRDATYTGEALHSTVPAVHIGATDVAPRKVTAREVRQVIMN